MAVFEFANRLRQRRRHLLLAALLAVVAPALFWIGRSSAGPAGAAHPAAASRSFANIPTGKSDAADATDLPCTVSPNYTDMPGMSLTFKLGGSTSRPVVVSLQAQWFMPNEGVTIRIRMLIDGVVQGPTDVLVVERPTGVSLVDGTHGFDFISNLISPGTHTVKIQWHDNGVSFGCAANRTLIVMHK